jgi:hypothetical protein
MVRWPAPDRLSRVSAPLIERFKKTSIAKELEQDGREWTLSMWPWLPDAPYAYTALASDGEQRRVIIDERDDVLVHASHASPAARGAVG